MLRSTAADPHGGSSALDAKRARLTPGPLRPALRRADLPGASQRDSTTTQRTTSQTIGGGLGKGASACIV